VFNELEHGPDYLSVSVWGSIQAVLQRVGVELLNCTPWDDVFDLFRELEHGARGFGRVLVGPGITIYADPVQAKESFVHVEVKGQGLESVPITNVISLLKGFESEGWRWQVSRLDLAWDHCGFSPRTMYEAARRKDVRVSLRRRAGWCRFIDSLEAEVGESEDGDEQAGQTCYIGSSRSPRQLCVYNRRGFTRCEFRLRGERAAAVARDLLQYPEHEWSARGLCHLTDFIAFVDAASDPCITRCKPLPWWQQFIGDAKRSGVRILRALPKVFESAREKRKRSTRELAIQASVFGRDFVVSELDRAVKVMRDEDCRRGRVLGVAVRSVVEDLGEDVARCSCWPDQTVSEMMSGWSRAARAVCYVS
jgi:hypothetical protein